jgi:hypothetical protein
MASTVVRPSILLAAAAVYCLCLWVFHARVDRWTQYLISSDIYFTFPCVAQFDSKPHLVAHRCATRGKAE